MSVKGIVKGVVNKVIHRNEELAKERFDVCKDCEYLEDEPVDFLQVNDDRILGASKKMCGDCGCVLPLKLRQNEDICRFWKR